MERKEFLADEGLRPILQMFVNNAPERLSKMRVALADNSRSDLIKVAHELRGTAANFGYTEISAAAAFIEDKGIGEDPLVIKTYIDKIDSLLRAAKLQSV